MNGEGQAEADDGGEPENGHAWYEDMTTSQRLFWHAARDKLRAKKLNQVLSAGLIYKWVAILIVIFSWIGVIAGDTHWLEIVYMGLITSVILLGLFLEYFVIVDKSEVNKHARAKFNTDWETWE